MPDPRHSGELRCLLRVTWVLLLLHCIEACSAIAGGSWQICRLQVPSFSTILEYQSFYRESWSAWADCRADREACFLVQHLGCWLIG